MKSKIGELQQCGCCGHEYRDHAGLPESACVHYSPAPEKRRCDCRKFVAPSGQTIQRGSGFFARCSLPS
jgi:hypothetical protein